MKTRMRLFILALMFFGAFSVSCTSFAEYAWLSGKSAQLHGPKVYDHLGVSLDKQTCNYLTMVYQNGDQNKFEEYLLTDHRVMRVDNNTEVLVLSIDEYDGKARVAIFTGFYRGMTGWIPIEWLDENQTRPQFSKIHR